MALIYGDFVCPLCGTQNRWGTSMVRVARSGRLMPVKTVDEAYGHCNGWFPPTEETWSWMRCEFVWNRCDDEWVFTPYSEN